MAPYTLPVSEAEINLRDLIKRTQTTHNPVLLTSEETAKPVAVVMEIDAYEHVQRQQQRLYQLQLMQLKQSLSQVEQQWKDKSLRKECIAIWQANIVSLWDVCPEPARGLCASLMLSVKLLDEEQLSLGQVAALQYCIKLLRYSAPDDADIETAYQQLIESGIPPMLSFDDSFIQSYIDES